jgi:hypothetical protein
MAEESDTLLVLAGRSKPNARDVRAFKTTNLRNRALIARWVPCDRPSFLKILY